MLAGTRSAMWGWTVMVELKRAILRRAASALGRDSRASASSKRIWRWRLEGSTKSRSMRVRVPTPARARREAVAAPVAPTPTMATWAEAKQLLAGGADAGEEDLAGVAVVSVMAMGDEVVGVLIWMLGCGSVDRTRGGWDGML